MIERHIDTSDEGRLQTVRDVLMEADLAKQMRRQVKDGVTNDEVTLPNPTLNLNPDLLQTLNPKPSFLNLNLEHQIITSFLDLEH